MIKPIEVKADLEANASYVRYRELRAGEHVAETIDVVADGSVAVDIDAEGQVIGIEILGFNEDTLKTAHEFARSKDLGFPKYLAGVAPESQSQYAYA